MVKIYNLNARRIMMVLQWARLAVGDMLNVADLIRDMDNRPAGMLGGDDIRNATQENIQASILDSRDYVYSRRGDGTRILDLMDDLTEQLNGVTGSDATVIDEVERVLGLPCSANRLLNHEMLKNLSKALIAPHKMAKLKESLKPICVGCGAQLKNNQPVTVQVGDDGATTLYCFRCRRPAKTPRELTEEAAEPPAPAGLGELVPAPPEELRAFAANETWRQRAARMPPPNREEMRRLNETVLANTNRIVFGRN